MDSKRSQKGLLQYSVTTSIAKGLSVNTGILFPEFPNGIIPLTVLIRKIAHDKEFLIPMLENYYLDITRNSLRILEEIKENPLLEKVAEKGRNFKMRGAVNVLDYTYGMIYKDGRSDYPLPMRWGVNLGHQNTITSILPLQTLNEVRWYIPNRCYIPASWYYETETPINAPETPRLKTEKKINPVPWKGAELDGIHLTVSPEGRELCNFAAVYRTEEDDLPTFSLIMLSDGMPLMLPDKMTNVWVNPNLNPQEAVDKRVRRIKRRVSGQQYF